MPDPPAARDLGHVSGEIRFEKAWFAYSDERWVLRSLDLTVRAGETLAIVGTTGAGKSTLVKLLLRFYDPARGRILIDGIELTALRPADLRRVTGYVPQEPFLFSGTVAENLRFARAEASDEEIESALRELGGEEALAALPEGLATQVGERGESLSSGQRQLVALARAMIADPRLLVVDEATSGIDVATERQVQAALDRLSANRTTVVIAHRLSTVRNADRIAVIGRGQVLELGTHDELAALGGEYAELVGLTPRERAGRPEQDSNLRPTP